MRKCAQTVSVIGLVAIVMLGAFRAHGEDGEQRDGERPRWGGPDAVNRQLEDDASEKDSTLEGGPVERLLDSWEDKKRELESRGRRLGFDYSALYLRASDSLGEDEAAGGVLRLYGSLNLVGRDTDHEGGIVYKIEHRHRLGTDIPPSRLGFEAGYVGLIEPTFSEQQWRLSNLYWRQELSRGRFQIVAGWVDAGDYLDVYALASPWTAFGNFVFSTGNASIPLPNEGLGIAVGGYLTERVYAIAGFTDTNSDPHDPRDGFESFFNDHEYFKHLELGWTTSRSRFYLDNVHVSLWHVDERDDALVSDGWGVTASFTHFVRDRWMPFVRAGYASDGGALLERSVTLGLGFQPQEENLVGIAVNWGDPNSDDFGSGRTDQYTAELFYRIQLTDHIAITPSLQHIRHPALNSDDDSLWIFGLRARLAL